jgi:predicted enzyme related to lactoylglutathione lyase
MPAYDFDHVHHETADVGVAVDFYKRVFGATSEAPFERGGATWVAVHIGAAKITVTDRDFRAMELGRYQGYDHLALTTDDFEASLRDIEHHAVPIWTGPITLETGQRLVFVIGPDNTKIEIMEQV